MTEQNVTNRVDPPLNADEATTLLSYLDYQRATLRQKAAGLDAAQLRSTHAPSTLTLAGILKHCALNEAHWFGWVLHGRMVPEPFASADWQADVDWEMTSALEDSPEAIAALLDSCVAGARANIAEAIASGGLEFTSNRPSKRQPGEFYSLRWILIHMIEEYARHNGHADLIRESIDGATGE